MLTPVGNSSSPLVWTKDEENLFAIDPTSAPTQLAPVTTPAPITTSPAPSVKMSPPSTPAATTLGQGEKTSTIPSSMTDQDEGLGARIEEHLNGEKKGYFQAGCLIAIVVLLILIAMELLAYMYK